VRPAGGVVDVQLVHDSCRCVFDGFTLKPRFAGDLLIGRILTAMSCAPPLRGGQSAHAAAAAARGVGGLKTAPLRRCHDRAEVGIAFFDFADGFDESVAAVC